MSPKNPWLWIGGVVVVVLIVVAAWYSRTPESANEQVADTNQTPAANEEASNPEPVAAEPEDSEPAASAPAKTPAKPVVTPKPSNAYELAMEKYKYRLQFVNCHGTASLPGAGTLVVKKNVQFMLDNRDKVAHTFVFASRSYKVGGEQWLIQSIAKPGKYNITCDGGGAGTIQVED